ncbi:saccharopine dehydrogenase NADP-binding domain-containing protein [Flavobacteriaceae bacterium]|nr:saccharopine dehydrogenase NADP-binding domain-containing protein [Flavobacteriaceae bacterium]
MMRNILLIGAGKSTAYLIDYLLDQSKKEGISLCILDKETAHIPKQIASHPALTIVTASVTDIVVRQKQIALADIVISMLPAHMHILVAKDCLALEKHLVTASYVSPELKEMEEQVKEKGLIFLNEMGVDPGIDHMSAMAFMDQIKNKGGEIKLFESFTGGLVAPQEKSNLWDYKFTWNPRNVVIAGQGGAAKFIQEGTYKYIPYHKLFRRTEFMHIEGYGKFEAYANRDSLKYRTAYGLENALTLYRGTMRRVGFSKAWNIFVQLGLTDDSYHIEDSEQMSYRAFINLFLPYSPTDSVELKVRHYLKIDQDDIMWDKLMELHLFSDKHFLTKQNGTPAELLQEILEAHWTLGLEEKDMVVMYHKIGYEYQGEMRQLDAHMVVEGVSQTHTAMAKTVGLPLAMSCLLILNKDISTPGVRIPIHQEIYGPVLKLLAQEGVVFKDFEVAYLGYATEYVASS